MNNSPIHKKSKSTSARFSNGQKLALGLCSAALIVGLAAGGIYLATHQEDNTTIISDDASTSTGSTALVDGKNKITAGGTYTFTGSTANGKIVVDTTDEVKIILSNVSISNSDGAAIKCKEGSNVTIELIGDNQLTTTDQGTSTDDPAAAISSDGSLTIIGDGTASVQSNGKGIKAETALNLSSGTLNITAGDDAIHSNSDLTISGGTYTLNTGDDAVHADSTLTISDGHITIEKSNEGLEAVNLTISGGEISVTASDDGINAQNSNGSTMIGVAGDGNLTISGGKIYVNASGDGLDSNGSITISGGEIYVDGPTNNGNGAIDCDGEISITGGTLIAVGSSGMAQNATSATQPSVLMNLSGSFSGELTFGNIKFTPSKNYQSVLISSDQLKVGETYSLTIGGQTVKTVTISNNIAGDTSQGMGGGMMPGGQPGQGAQGGQSGQGPQAGQPSQSGQRDAASGQNGQRDTASGQNAQGAAPGSAAKKSRQ